jgi:hypothetical protein
VGGFPAHAVNQRPRRRTVSSGRVVRNRSEPGKVIGLLYAGNFSQTYACPIDKVLAGFNCSLLS